MICYAVVAFLLLTRVHLNFSLVCGRKKQHTRTRQCPVCGRLRVHLTDWHSIFPAASVEKTGLRRAPQTHTLTCDEVFYIIPFPSDPGERAQKSVIKVAFLWCDTGTWENFLYIVAPPPKLIEFYTERHQKVKNYSRVACFWCFG